MNYGRRSYGIRRTLSPGEGLKILAVAALIFVLTGMMLIWSARNGASEANAVQCSIELRGIGTACLLYANQHGGQWPDSFKELVLGEYLTADQLLCADSYDRPANGPTTQAVAENLSAGGHISYVYIGKGLKDPVPRNVVVAYDNEENHSSVGMNVLFGDGHVERIKPRDVRKFLAAVKAANGPTTWPADK